MGRTNLEDIMLLDAMTAWFDFGVALTTIVLPEKKSAEVISLDEYRKNKKKKRTTT